MMMLIREHARARKVCTFRGQSAVPHTHLPQAVYFLMAESDRIPVKTLTKMMVAGQNQVVMKYLRTLPSEECAEVREQLIKNLELIQQQQRKGGAPTSTKASDSPSSSQPSSARDAKPSKDKESSSGSKSGSSSSSRSKDRNPAGSSSKSGGSSGATTKEGSKLPVTNAKDSPAQSDDGSSASEKSDSRPNVGNYVYQKDLGKGQFGVVFKAKHAVSGVRVAVKEICTDQVAASNLPGIMLEAEVMADLDHNNCLKIFEVIKTKKKIYFILDYINRGSLLGLIKSQGNFTDEVAAYCVRHTCEGLKYLHGKNIIHRDIKCANLLINSEGIIKLADFGTAKEDAGKNFTVIGTPFWMAPEIIEVSGASTVSDIWSLGCTIVEMLRGTPPYFELVTMQALFKIVEDPHPPIPQNFSVDSKNFLLTNCFVKDVKKRTTAEGILKTAWIAKCGTGNIDFVRLCNMIKGIKESAKETATQRTSTPKAIKTSSNKYPTAPMQSSSSSGSLSTSGASSSAKYPSLGSKGLKGQGDGGEFSLLVVQKLQLEVEQLCKEQAKLQKELDVLTNPS